ncbi:MAG: TonB-dependent receptor [Chlorobi bacterium]|nr:TonB-dependent receptor [Chlorobiota bacterium]
MNKKLLIFKKTEVFKHWKNNAWSTFSSIGKHIIISALPLAYFTASAFTSKAQTDTLQMQEVQINSSRIPTVYSETARIIYTIDKKEIEAMPVHSLQDLLEYVANVDVRQRGSEGVQADINIRGGNFDQTLILLNGFKMNDVQTGHHNMDLPVEIENIEKIEILEGPGNRIFGINAYSGAINFITDSQTAKKLKTGIFAGQHNYFGGNISISHTYKKFSNYLSASYKKSDGYLTDSINDTDFKILNIFYQNQLHSKFANISLQAGYTDKSFGANSFYTPKFPWQYEETKTSFAALKSEKQGTHYKITHRISLRRHQDRFELFREDKYKHTGKYFIDDTDTAKYVPGIYEDWNYYSGHNYHLTYDFGTELKLNLDTKAGKSAIGAEYSYAEIKSNVLGEPLENPENVPGEPDGLFTKSKSRKNINLYAEHLVKFNKFIISGGASLNFDEMFKRNFSGGIDLSYALTKNFRTFASFNQSVRLPTFTDLYYDGPTNKGNPDLQPETALNYEVGIKYFTKGLHSNISVFRRNGKNTIDWVRLSDTVDWQAQNITELQVTGAELSVNYTFLPNSVFKNIRFSYAYTNITKQSRKYISKYALDYLNHKAVLSLNHKLYKRFSANWNLRYEDRNGSYSVYDLKTRTYTGEEEYKPYILTDVRVLWKSKKIEVFADASNLFNVKYHEFGNILMPGRWVKAGIRMTLDY